MRKNSLLLALFVMASQLFAQSLYDEGTVQTISITFAQSNWDALLDAEKAVADGYIMAQNVTINGISYDSVGVKYKGNSTYSSNRTKNPFHIELDTYKDQDYQGYKDIKLSNVYNDPSFVREVLSYKVLRNYMDAPLSNYANVSVNGNLIGLYSNSEAITKTFVDDRFGSKKNTFVKCNPPAGAGPGSSDYPNLVYLGTDSNLYYAKYEIKSDYGWNELIHLCDTLSNHTSAIEDILDVDRALWMLAFNNVLVNLDSYSGGFAQNYYLYRDDNGRFIPIVWDLNESFGVFSMTGTGTLNSTTAKQQMSHLLNSTSSNYPLISKLLNVPTYKKMYFAHVKTMLQDNFTNNGSYYTQGLALQSTINSSVQADQNKFYTYANFTSNLTSDISTGGGGPPRPGSTTPGITSLMNGRYSYLMGLSDFSATEPSISMIAVSDTAPMVNGSVFITAAIANEISVLLRYRTLDNAVFEKATMLDDGLHGDGAANDGIYGANVKVSSAELEYYIYAENNTIGKFSPTNAEHVFYSLNAAKAAPGDLVINEFLASNSTINADQDAEYDDWIELYNNGNQVIDISGYKLSDDIKDLDQFSFPTGTTIQPNGYVTVWADNDLTQAGFHAGFKISSSGETLILSDATMSIIDSVTFGAQVSDVSYGRFANGTGNFQLLSPTFGAQNAIADSANYDIVINEFLASNTATVADSYGDFDDWIELYNKGSQTVDLSTFSLSDDITDLDLFKFPSGTMLMPDSFIIVWADNDSAQVIGSVGFHAEFKLSAVGESIYLSDGPTIVDSISYLIQVTDSSFGRYPNGTGNFQRMFPTFKSKNIISTGLNNNSLRDAGFIFYPNPASESFTIKANGSNRATDVFIYNATGQMVYSNNLLNELVIDVSNWSKGIYFIRAEETTTRIIVH